MAEQPDDRTLCCPCGRGFASLGREYDHIENTIGRAAADEFDAIHERHVEDEDERLYESGETA